MTIAHLTRIYVDGQWIDSTSSATVEVVNPATEEVLAEISAGSDEDAARAVAAARAAFDGWSSTPPLERAKYLTRLAEALEARGEEIAATISDELGVPRHLAFATQVRSPLTKLAAHEGFAAAFPWEERVGRSTVVRAPVGVVVAITPWNFPLNQAIDKIAPALLAGCTVVLKPSEVTPLCTLALAELVDEVGFPAGVFNLVNGLGATVGEALVRHPDVDMISFTGSTRSGTRIAALAAERVARVGLELGGKSATVILDDADLDTAIPAAVRGCYYNSGQVCVSLSRLLAPRRHYDDVVRRVADLVSAYSMGDPDSAVDLGPLVSGTQRDRVRGYIDTGIAEGARLVVGGADAPEGLERGYYVRPTVFADVDNSMTIAQEEIFGPVLSIIPYEDDDDAVRIANDSPYGLSGAVWSADVARAQRVARRIRTGTVNINGAFETTAPFGGFKRSGIGREHGLFGIEEFVELQTIAAPDA